MLVLFTICVPFALLGYLKDNLVTASIGIGATCVAIILIISSLYFIKYPINTTVPIFKPTIASFISAVGYLLSASAALVVLIPNLMFDIENHNNFQRSLIAASVTTICLCTVVGVIPYKLYEGKVHANILESIRESTSKVVAAEVFSTLCYVVLSFHCVAVLIINMNPIFQMIEETLKIPKGEPLVCLIESYLNTFHCRGFFNN